MGRARHGTQRIYLYNTEGPCQLVELLQFVVEDRSVDTILIAATEHKQRDGDGQHWQ